MELETAKKLFSEKFAMLCEKYTRMYKCDDMYNHALNHLCVSEYEFLYKKILAIYANRNFHHCIFSGDKVVGCLSDVGRLFLSDSFDMDFSKLGVYCKLEIKQDRNKENLIGVIVPQNICDIGTLFGNEVDELIVDLINDLYETYLPDGDENKTTTDAEDEFMEFVRNITNPDKLFFKRGYCIFNDVCNSVIWQESQIQIQIFIEKMDQQLNKLI